jgi:hypothetical protein
MMQAGYLLLAVNLIGFFVLDWVFGLSRTAGYVLFVVLVLNAEICIASCWGPWSAWARAFATKEDRGLFLARMQRASQLVTTAALTAIALSGRLTAAGYRLLVAILFCYLIFAIRQFSFLPEPAASVAARPSAATLLGALRERRLWGLYGVACVQMVIGFPLLAVYTLEVLHYPATAITLAFGCRTVANFWCIGAWGRLADRIGYRRAMGITGTALGCGLLSWMLMPTHSGALSVAVLVSVVCVVGVLKSGFAIAFNVSLYEQIPESLSVPAFTILDVISSTTGQVYAAVSGIVMAHAATGISPVGGGIVIDSYKVAVAAAGIAALLLARVYRTHPSVVDDAAVPACA